MNKQEAIELLKNYKYTCPLNEKETKYNSATDNAITVIEQIEEHEKPTLTKEEAEWLDKLTDVYDTPDALYYITRCGYESGFKFSFWGDIYELPLEDGIDYIELNEIRKRLVDAVVYGYEVEKGKLYVVAIPDDERNKFIQLWKNRDGKLFFNFEHSIKYGNIFLLTEEEIKNKDKRLWEFAKEVKNNE